LGSMRKLGVLILGAYRLLMSSRSHTVNQVGLQEGINHVRNIWWIYPLGGRVSDYFCSVLPARSWLCSRRRLLITVSIREGGYDHVRWWRIWRIHPLGGCISDYLRFVHSARSICNNNLHNYASLLIIHIVNNQRAVLCQLIWAIGPFFYLKKLNFIQ
jgi:hypothetical protein